MKMQLSCFYRGKTSGKIDAAVHWIFRFIYIVEIEGNRVVEFEGWTTTKKLEKHNKRKTIKFNMLLQSMNEVQKIDINRHSNNG